MVAAKSSRVNCQYKKKYRIRNWREYERGLRSRGEVTPLLWTVYGFRIKPHLSASIHS